MKSKYSDSDPLHVIERGYNESTRSLMFHSTEIEVDKLEEALDIIGGYNEFDSKKVAKALIGTFGDKCRYIVGREYSVAVYVVPILASYHFWSDDLKDLQKEAIADEVVMVNGRLRMWWD